jgi:hypothetical protein
MTSENIFSKFNRHIKNLWLKYSPFTIDDNIKNALEIIKEARDEAQMCRNGIQEVKAMFDLARFEYERHKMFATALGDTMTDMLWLKDPRGVYLFANPVIKRDLLCNEHVVGKNDLVLSKEAKLVFGSDKHTFGELCANSDLVVLQTGVPQTFHEYGKVRGKDLYLEVRKFLVYNSDGSLLGVGGVGSNITDYYLGLKKARQAISDAVENMGCAGSFSSAPCVIELREQLIRLDKEIDRYKFEG